MRVADTNGAAPPSGAPATPAEAAAPAVEGRSTPPTPADASDGAPATGEPARTGPSEAFEPTAFAGPPDDATTTFEDLPGDLFGEPEPPPERRPEERPPSAGSSASADRPAGREAGPAPRRSDPRDTLGSRADATSAGGESADPAIDMVQTFFPGRIVALEPGAEDPDDAASEDAPDAAGPDVDADGGPDDGAARRSG